MIEKDTKNKVYKPLDVPISDNTLLIQLKGSQSKFSHWLEGLNKKIK